MSEFVIKTVADRLRGIQAEPDLDDDKEPE